jgi:hypothetical protein
VKVQIEPSTPKDQLSPKLTNSPSKKKPHTCQQIVVMEGGDEDMETDVTTQQDDKLIRTKSDQFMEERSELDFEQVLN